MRHRVHRTALGRTKEHRAALMANMSAALIRHGRIETTLAKAKALRPFAEKVITLAKKAKQSDSAEEALHYRRIALARVRDKRAVHQLFNERAEEFLDRPGGYTRIYKLGARTGDAAEMALIQLIEAADEGYPKRRKPSSKKASKKKTESASAEIPADQVATETHAEEDESTKASVETATATVEAEPEKAVQESEKETSEEEDILAGALEIGDEEEESKKESSSNDKQS